MDSETEALVVQLMASDLRTYEANAGYMYPPGPVEPTGGLENCWGASENQASPDFEEMRACEVSCWQDTDMELDWPFYEDGFGHVRGPPELDPYEGIPVPKTDGVGEHTAQSRDSMDLSKVPAENTSTGIPDTLISPYSPPLEPLSDALALSEDDQIYRSEFGDLAWKIHGNLWEEEEFPFTSNPTSKRDKGKEKATSSFQDISKINFQAMDHDHLLDLTYPSHSDSEDISRPIQHNISGETTSYDSHQSPSYRPSYLPIRQRHNRGEVMQPKRSCDRYRNVHNHREETEKASQDFTGKHDEIAYESTIDEQTGESIVLIPWSSSDHHDDFTTLDNHNAVDLEEAAGEEEGEDEDRQEDHAVPLTEILLGQEEYGESYAIVKSVGGEVVERCWMDYESEV